MMTNNTMEHRWTRKRIEFNGFAVSYLEGGVESQDIPILFLHGWSVFTEAYRESLSALAQNHWVIAPDLPGFGFSWCDRANLSYQTHAHCILQLIERLNLERFRLIGHSFGGGIALALAAAIPHQVDLLIIIDSTGIPLSSLSQIITGRLSELPQQIIQLRWKTVEKILWAFGHNTIFHGRHLIEGAQIALNQDIRPWLKDIRSPCLVLWGERDRFTPPEIGRGLMKEIPQSKLQIVPGGYHEWCMMQPETLTAIVTDFFNSVDSQIDQSLNIEH